MKHAARIFLLSLLAALVLTACAEDSLDSIRVSGSSTTVFSRGSSGMHSGARTQTNVGMDF